MRTIVDVDQTQLLLNYTTPLIYVQKLTDLTGSSPPGIQSSHPQSRYWASNPRRMDDDTWEILTVSFRTPVSVSQISFELYEISQQWEFWYYDRNNTRLPILDNSLRQFQGTIATGGVNTWYAFLNTIRPIVATQIEFRIKRVLDQYIPAASSISLGVRNLLFKRNIYSRDDAIQPLGNEVDAIGNLVENFINDWNPPQAIDGNTATFWKSAPQPSPNAVACFYLDIRDVNGNPQRTDRMYVNPVYSGQPLNLYWSNDDAVVGRQLNNTFLPASSTSNAGQVPGSGLDLSETTSNYAISTGTLGLQRNQSIWVGLEWTPNFNSGQPPAYDLDLFADNTNSFYIRYRSLTGVVECHWGTETFDTPINYAFNAGSTVGIAFRVVFPDDPSGVISGMYCSIFNQSGVIIGSNSALTPPTNIPIQPIFSFGPASGYLAQIFIKQEGATQAQVQAALQNAGIYIKPDVSSGQTSLTNMVYGADFTQDEEGYGGLDTEYFTAKEWTPMFVDWTLNKGFLYFPLPVTCKYIKLEMTGLTQEAYPIYETGIQVEYQTFPIDVQLTSTSVLQQNTDTITTQNRQTSSLNGVLYNNYYTSSTYQQSITQLPQDLQVTVGLPGTQGGGTLSTSVPQLYNTPITSTTNVETTSSAVTRSSTSTNVQDISQNTYYTVQSGNYLIEIGQMFGIPWQEIYAANQGEIAGDPRVGLLPQRSAGWWIFPGQVLVIPNAIMNQITTTSTTTEQYVSSTTTTTTRTRFTTTQVHQYDVQTATRDAAIAYFAGISEIQVFRLDYTQVYDNEQYIIPTYDSIHFTLTNVQTFPTGAWERLNPATVGILKSLVWPSMSFFQKLIFNPVDRGLRRTVDGQTVNAISITGQVQSTWNDAVANWNDSVATWNSAPNLLSVNVQSNAYYSGRTAAAIQRPAGAGVGGVQGENFAIEANSRIRLGVDFFVPDPTSTSPLVLQLCDMSSGSAVVLVQYTIPSSQAAAGQWNNFTSTFYTDIAGHSNVVIRFLIEGTNQETVYIGDLYPEVTTILYEASNDGGNTWYDITDAAYDNNKIGYFMFPTLGNELQFRTTLNDPADYVYGLTATPFYTAY